ncbi:nucleotide sugar dehydrogenase [Halovenus salina]|uniref:nucleotide sugar dehydrogenase n=1 Tax=Halovenus salina TaxID=1510225 RepID=UPI002260DA1C|nr:nucleotide sugar dehydrogenase [Halovenus salina]
MNETTDSDEKRASESTQIERIKGRTVCVVGLGYVGLPLAIEFDREGLDVVGYDVSEEKIAGFRNGTDPTQELSDKKIAESNIQFTVDSTPIERADYMLVGVPTPVDEMKNPNLEYVSSAGRTVGRHLKKGTTVVLESTVYPGATREVLVPAIEETSGLTAGEDFAYGYSPERMVPGDDEHGLRDVVKIVSGHDEEALDEIARLYEMIVEVGVHRAPEIEVAEAAKVAENVQRDLNIALMNELAVTCDALSIDTHDVLDAAGTKWNFHEEYGPGLVGGHCIPVDPFYIIYESERNGYSPKLMQQGREINEYMPRHVAELTLRGLNECGKVLQESTVLVLGLAYKQGVGDIRTSAVDGVIDRLQEYSVQVEGYDPHADDDAMAEEFDAKIRSELQFRDVDAVVVATPHEPFLELKYLQIFEAMAEKPLVVDVMGFLDSDEMETIGFDYRRV